MSSRQRGATWLLVAILVGRLLDVLDLPFERRHESDPVHLGVHGDSLRLERGADGYVVDNDESLATRPWAPTPRSARAPRGAPIDVNRASASELQTLPRVGPVLAARIVEWRRSHGPFRSLHDLQKVPGIGSRTAAQLAPLVRFD